MFVFAIEQLLHFSAALSSLYAIFLKKIIQNVFVSSENYNLQSIPLLKTVKIFIYIVPHLFYTETKFHVIWLHTFES